MVSMITGRQALQTLERGIAGVRAEEGRLDAALASASETAARLRQERAASLRELARIKLDALMRDEVAGQIEAAERRALQIMADRKHRLAGLTAGRQAAQLAEQMAETARHEKAAALEAALEALDTFRVDTEPQVRAGPDWIAQSARVDEAVRIAAEAERKAATAEADREEKGQPYEADPLFMYLWERKFGTADYASTGLTRFLDRWVARLVRYHEARPNYLMLNEIPTRLREHAKARAQDIEEQRAKLAEIEREGLARAGIAAHEERAATAREALAGAEAELAAAREQLAEFDRRMEAETGGSERGAYAEAIETIANADARDDIRTLYEEARRTATPKDEAIVRGIEALDARIAAADREVEELRRQARTIASRRGEAEQARDEFRKRGYDNPYGGFSNGQAIADVIAGVLAGVLHSGRLNDVLRDGYRERRPRSDPDFGRRRGAGPAPGIPLPGGGGWDPWGGGGAGSWGGGGSSGGPWGAPSLPDIGGGGGGGNDGFRTGGTF